MPDPTVGESHSSAAWIKPSPNGSAATAYDRRPASATDAAQPVATAYAVYRCESASRHVASAPPVCASARSGRLELAVDEIVAGSLQRVPVNAYCLARRW